MKSLATALHILNEFVLREGSHSVIELAERLAINKSQVSKVLKTFREAGFVTQSPETRKYSVGLNAFALGNNFINADPLSREALPVMRKLVDRTGHSAVLSVLHGSNVIHLLAVEGRLFIDGRWRVGRWMPYHTTSAGKVLLAFGPKETMEYLLKTRGLPRLTPNSIVDPRAFRAAVHKVAKSGVAVTRSETYQGSAAISVPLFGPGIHATAALGLVCPEHLLTAGEEARLAPVLHDAARELSSRMGCDGYPFGH
jgi:DNA-binding IclR family transcriptional regulator